jgi:hypothetical protein
MDNQGINTTPAPERKIQVSKRTLLVAIAFIIILLGIIFTIVELKPNQPKQNIVYRTYNDKGKYFSIQIPQNWTTSQDVAQGTIGVGTPQEATQNIEEAQLSDTFGTGIQIQVYEGTPTCPLDQKLNMKLAGFPAAYEDSSGTWTIPTTKALITITVTYPGSNAIHHVLLQNAPTPVPSAVAEKNKNVMGEILKTLKLSNLVPFSC